MAEINIALISKLRERTGAGLGDCRKALNEVDGDIENAIDILRKKGIATAAKKAGRSTLEGVIAQVIAPGAKAGVIVEIDCETDFVAKNEKFQAFCAEIAQAYLDNDNADLEEQRVAAVAEIGENIQLVRHERLGVEGSGSVAAYIHHGAKVGVLVEVSTGKEETTQADDYKQLVKDITLQIAASSPVAVTREDLDPQQIEREKSIAAEQFKDKPAGQIENILRGKMEKYYQAVCLVDQAHVREQDSSVKEHLAAVGKAHDDEIAVQRFHRFQVGESADD